MGPADVSAGTGLGLERERDRPEMRPERERATCGQPEKRPERGPVKGQQLTLPGLGLEDANN